MSLADLIGYSIFRKSCPLHPWMAKNLRQRRPVACIYLQQSTYNLFKLLAEVALATRLVLAVLLPEHSRLLSGYALIVWVFGPSLDEWDVASNQNEKDDTQSEDVNLGSLVR